MIRVELQCKDYKRAGKKLAFLQQFLHQQEANVDIILMVASSKDNFTVIELNCFSVGMFIGIINMFQLK